METFFCDEDYEAYLSLLGQWCGEFDVRIWAYCLMPNLPAAGRSRPFDPRAVVVGRFAAGGG